MTIPIQLAIQGGGAKITHLIAALQAVQGLEREGVLRVTRIAGTSAGAIAGALYAAGVDMQRARDAFAFRREELLRAFPPTSAWLRAAWKFFTRQPFWDARPLRRVLVSLLAPCARLRDLRVPLIIVAADLTNLQPRVYDAPEEPLISSLMDSAGIPFFFRTALPQAHGDHRIVVDGGVCENLPSEKLAWSPEEGEVVGITFSVSRSGAPLTGYLDFARALLETALNASVLRAQLALGMNSFVIRSDAGSFDFQRAFDRGLGAEYQETLVLAEAFFRGYAARAAAVREAQLRAAALEPSLQTELPEARLHDVVGALRSMYREQQEPIAFELLSIRMIVTAASQATGGHRGADQVRHEIVFRAAKQPVSCYKIRLTSSAGGEQRTRCDVFDRTGHPIAFDLVPIAVDPGEGREYLLFFRSPIVPNDARAPVTLRVRDTVPRALRLAEEGRDELLTRASRADRPIAHVEIIVHLPDELADTVIAAAPGSRGVRMSPAELMPYPAPAGFFTLGWKGEKVTPGARFGCNLMKP
ncbi:MAG TPA: patatin-like phospholipase family protein [Thermoanaerobaculia bacterium]|nr:patatin-like phospholipase family protein [Thermoanaerobaculia bacterium]